MKRAKKSSVDTAQEKSKILAALSTDIKPPAHIAMDDKDMLFFKSVIAEFVRAEWTDHTLELAAMLARAMHDMEFEQRKLRAEGTVSYSAKETPVINPRKQAVQMNAAIILSLRRSLALHARAQEGEGRDIGKRRTKGKQIEAQAGAMEDDDGLIPNRSRVLN